MTINKEITGKSYLDILKYLEINNIESRPLWKPMHLQPIFKDIPYHGSGFDKSLFNSGLCIPSSSNLTSEEQSEIIELILELF